MSIYHSKKCFPPTRAAPPKEFVCPECSREDTIRLCKEFLMSEDDPFYAIVVWIMCDECELKREVYTISKDLYRGPPRERDDGNR